MELSKGAGYSVEAILAALILFTFAMNAIQVPDGKSWAGFQREISARDISFVLKETGELDTFLRNSNTGSIRTAATSISSRNLKVSGSIDNLPLNEVNLGFHTMPHQVHVNNTAAVDQDDPCYGDLEELETNSERQVLRTNDTAGSLEEKYGVRLYFTDSDPRDPGGYNELKDYDSVWVDNGTRCIFTPSEGPYRTDEIFYWGNRTDSDPGATFDFKDHMVDNSFILYEADKAVEVRDVMNEPLNGIETDTSVDTFNFTTPGIQNYDILVFTENHSLERIDMFESTFRNFLSDGSVLLLMNMTRQDSDYSFVEDIGFEWMDLPYEQGVPDEYVASFSSFSDSEELETYFRGLKGSPGELTLKPGGNFISSQGAMRTSREDLLFARNVVYNTSDLDGEIDGSWTPTTSDCDEAATADFVFLNETFDPVRYEVDNLDLYESGCDERGLTIDSDRDGNKEGPFLENEIVEVESRRYVPQIDRPNDAEFVFAGSSKVELINYRKRLENIDGGRAARAAYEGNYSEEDMKMLVATLYWLRGDQVRFTGRTSSASLSTTAVGGIEGEVFIPYKADLRWSE
jgi:hypothetical protein